MPQVDTANVPDLTLILHKCTERLNSRLNAVFTSLQEQRHAAEQQVLVLQEALEKIARHHCVMGSTGDYRQGQLDALEATRSIAQAALSQTKRSRTTQLTK